MAGPLLAIALTVDDGCVAESSVPALEERAEEICAVAEKYVRAVEFSGETGEDQTLRLTINWRGHVYEDMLAGRVRIEGTDWAAKVRDIGRNHWVSLLGTHPMRRFEFVARDTDEVAFCWFAFAMKDGQEVITGHCLPEKGE